MNKFEQDLKASLDEWALKGHGIALAQINAAFFIQVLRSKGYEIIHLGDVQKVRHEHHVIASQVLEAYRQIYAAKQRIEMLSTQKEEILKEETKPKPKKLLTEEKEEKEEKNEQN